MQNTGNLLFPIFLKLDVLKVLIVGGGVVALEKLRALLANNPNAEITLVSIEINDEIIALAKDHPNIHLVKRRFIRDDLTLPNIAIVAVGDVDTSSEIVQLAKEKKVLVNVADKPALCDFYLGSIVQKGQVKIAISTNGKSPTLAKRLKAHLQEMLPEELDDLAEHLNLLRNQNHGSFAEKVDYLNKLTASLLEK